MNWNIKKKWKSINDVKKKKNEYNISTETKNEEKSTTLKNKEYIHSLHYNSSQEQIHGASEGTLCVDVASEKCFTASIKRHQLLLIHKNVLG